MCTNTEQFNFVFVKPSGGKRNDSELTLNFVLVYVQSGKKVFEPLLIV